MKRLAVALSKVLPAQKKKLENPGTVSFSDLRARAPRTLFCAAGFKQRHTQGYMDRIIAYARHLATR